MTSYADQTGIIHSSFRYLDRIIYDEEIYSKRRQPTLEIVQQIYNEEAESRFAVPERLIIRTFEFSSKSSAEAFVSDYFDTNEINESLASKALTHIKQLDQIEQKEILELHDGEMTSPIKVDDQWTVMLRRMKIPASKTPLEAVYQDVVDLHLQMQDQENMRNFYGLLIDQLDGIELKVGEDPSIQINEVILSGDELEPFVDSDQKVSEMSLDQFRNLLVSQQPIQKMLLKEFIAQKNYHERRDVLFLKRIFEETQLVRNDLAAQAKQNGKEITEQDYLNQFEQEIEFTPLLNNEMFAH